MFLIEPEPFPPFKWPSSPSVISVAGWRLEGAFQRWQKSEIIAES